MSSDLKRYPFKNFQSVFFINLALFKYSDYFQFDWNMTKNENMADISGLQMAYQAWRTVTNSGKETTLPGVNLDAQQLFFLNAAQVSPKIPAKSTTSPLLTPFSFQTYCSLLSPADYILLVEVDFHTPHPER